MAEHRGTGLRKLFSKRGLVFASHLRLNRRFLLPLLLLTTAGVLISNLVVADVVIISGQSQKPTSTTQGQDDSRQIVLDEFTKARPAKPTATPQATSRPNPTRKPSTVARARPPVYRRKTEPASSAQQIPTAEIAEVGVTLWRLRPSREDDSGARVLAMESGQSAQFTPERIEADQVLNLGDRVRMTIESPRAGYLYVIDREQYSDGTLGEPLLIFPTTRTRGGNNSVRPGALIDIPAQSDSPSYFTMKSDHPKYVGEVLTIIVVPQPFDGLTIGSQPMPIPLGDLSRWEKLLGAQTERFEMVGGAGTAWTEAEQAAALGSGNRTLAKDDPSPQTIYRVAARATSGLLVTVQLRSRR